MMTRQPQRDLSICIVGAGMSGLAMGVRLRKAGIESFRILEKADSVGGTWRENRYPGLSCDVPSFFYSYSFEPKLDWTHRFSPGPEIRAYFEGVAQKYDLLRHISFGTSVRSTRHEDDGWSIETDAGETLRADVLIDATGPLHIKHLPAIDGLESFEGPCFHSADWDHDAALEGKRIGVIGNGSTGVQMTAPLSEVAQKLSLFQRTPQWIFPVGNKPYSEIQKRRKRRFPIIARLTREWYKRLFEFSSVGVTRNGFIRKRIATGCQDYLASVKDPELRAKLTPDYEPGCKRLILSTSFYPTLEEANVDLVTEGIERVVPNGVITANGKLHELDVLVLATGFLAHAWGIDPVVGAEGQSLKEAWAAGPRTYRSIGIPGFPNFFMLVGPNSPIGNISVIDVAETQANYIMELIDALRSRPNGSIAPYPHAAAGFQASLREAMKATVWVSGCSSWYLDDEGTPTLWPWSAGRFHETLKRPDWNDWNWA